MHSCPKYEIRVYMRQQEERTHLRPLSELRERILVRLVRVKLVPRHEAFRKLALRQENVQQTHIHGPPERGVALREGHVLQRGGNGGGETSYTYICTFNTHTRGDGKQKKKKKTEERKGEGEKSLGIRKKAGERGGRGFLPNEGQAT